MKGEGQPLKWKQFLDYRLTISNNIDSRENASLMKPTAHIKRAYRIKSVIIFVLRKLFPRLKTSFLETLIKLLACI